MDPKHCFSLSISVHTYTLTLLIFKVYIGPNISTVHQMHQLSESAWIYTQLPWRAKEFKMSPFQVKQYIYYLQTTVN